MIHTTFFPFEYMISLNCLLGTMVPRATVGLVGLMTRMSKTTFRGKPKPKKGYSTVEQRKQAKST